MSRIFETSLKLSLKDTNSLPLDLAFAKLFPGYISFSSGDERQDKLGSDVQIQLKSRIVHGDLKIRDDDPRTWGEDDLAIELLSVAEHGVRGYENSLTDYLIWVFKSTGRIAVVPFKPFKRFYDANWNYWYFWRAEKPQKTAMKNGYSYHSIHCYVPFDLVADMASEVQVEPNSTDLLRN